MEKRWVQLRHDNPFLKSGVKYKDSLHSLVFNNRFDDTATELGSDAA